MKCKATLWVVASLVLGSAACLLEAVETAITWGSVLPSLYDESGVGNTLLAGSASSATDLAWDAELAIGTQLPAVEFAAGTSSGGEDVSLVSLPVRLSAPSLEPVTAGYSAGGTATMGTDYTIGARSLVFAPGQTEKAVALYVQNDTADEPDETAVLTLGSPVNAVLGATAAHIHSITDDDASDTASADWMPMTVPDAPEAFYSAIAIRASSPQDVFAVARRGSGPAILHFDDGQAWRQEPLPAVGSMTAVWADSPGNVWTVGESRIMHFDGEGWTVTDVAAQYDRLVTLWDIWGSGHDNVYAVGGEGVILHFDGAQWSKMEHPGEPDAFHVAVCGRASNDVYVLAGNCDAGGRDDRDVEVRVLHFDGRNWSVLPVTPYLAGRMGGRLVGRS